MRTLTKRLDGKLRLILFVASALGLLVTPMTIGRRRAPSQPAAAETRPARPEQARESYGRMPLGFEANRGQADGSVDFLARGAGYSLFLRPSEAVFVLRSDEGVASVNRKSEVRSKKSKVLRMRLVGARDAARAEGSEELAGKANYFVGDDPSKWRTGVPVFGRVSYAEVYEGVDLVYYGNQRQLEYDFRVAPGADARAVALEFEGADKVEVDDAGELLLKVGGETIRQPKPFVYQETAGARREVKGSYEVGRDGRVRFAVGEYDASLPLVIDPTLVYSTYLGGAGGDQAWAAAVDSSGSAYIAGFTNGTNFPTANAVQAANAGFEDAFVAKLNPAGTALVYSTYLGGSSSERARGIAVDSVGSAYVTGNTLSPNFPTVGPLQAARGANGDDAFVTKLNATGSAIVYSTYLGGSDSAEFGQAITVDSLGAAYVAGNTFSTDFPTLNPIQAAKSGGSNDAFLSKINAGGNALVYSTYLGGDGNDDAKGVAVDSSGNAYIVGETSSINFPRLNPIQAANAGDSDSFAAKINAGGNALVYSTYIGGGGQDIGQAVAVDSLGNAYVSGQTFSTNFPAVNAFQGANGGVGVSGASLQDATLTKINPAGNAFVYSTYLGGIGGEIAFDVAVDPTGAVYLGGATASTNTFPTANAIQCARGGGSDAFITKFNPAGTALVYSTYLGGSNNEEARGIGLDSAGNAYLGGFTRSTNFPTANPIQAAFGGDAIFGDAFITKVADAATGPASALQVTPGQQSVQEDVTSVTFTVQRTGDTSGAVTVDYATGDSTASERSDYTTAVGTLRFAAGETAKTIDVLINEDSKAEVNETFTVILSNPTGGATLSCLTAAATIQITDDAAEPTTNVIDDPTIFVGQHYHDFLNRQSDPSGLAFWTAQITSCNGNAACVDNKRTNVSQAFFLSIEFQQTGFLVFRFYKASFTDSPARPRGMPRYREFLRDTQEIGRNVVVGQGAWEAQLEANKQEFARRWVQRPDFLAEFPESMTFDAYVAKLAANSGVTLTPTEINILFEGWSNTVDGRAATLRRLIELGSVYNRQFNPAFVLSQYIGYLRRNPNDAPEPALNYSGFDFWLTKLDQFSQPGEDVRDPLTAQRRVQRAEMVRAFIMSNEYRQRFGQ